MKVNSTSQPPLVLTDGQEKYPLGFYLEILKDPTGELTIEDVSSSAYDARFLPSRVEVPNLGFTNHTYWVRFHLKNNTGKTDRWFLELNFANLHYEDLFLPAPKGGNWIVKESGILRALSTRDAATHHIVLAIPLSPQQEGTYYIRFRSGASMTLPLILWQPEAFYRNLAAEMIFLGLFYGALLIMLVYHLFVLYSLRETSYLYFVSFLGSSILWLLAYDGLAAQYLWPNRAGINRYVNLVFALIAIASILMFVDSFLELKRRHPRLHRLISGPGGRPGDWPAPGPFCELSCYGRLGYSLRNPLPDRNDGRRFYQLEKWIPARQVFPFCMAGTAGRHRLYFSDP